MQACLWNRHCYFFRLHSLLGEHADSQGSLVALWPNIGLPGSDGDGPPKTALGKKCQEAPLPSSQGKMKELRDRQILLNAEPLNLEPPDSHRAQRWDYGLLDCIDILFQIVWVCALRKGLSFLHILKVVVIAQLLSCV